MLEIFISSGIKISRNSNVIPSSSNFIRTQLKCLFLINQELHLYVAAESQAG